MSDKYAADFMQDQLEALLASPALAPVATRVERPVAGEAASPHNDSIEEGDTEPSIDVRMLREALRAGVK